MRSLSLVLPVWNEEEIIGKVVQEIVGVLEGARVDYELLLVENGSVDRSLEVIRELSRQNPRLRVVVRPKGYGSAVIGGLEEAAKEVVGYMPSDGQIEPRIIIECLKYWENGGYDLVKINRVERESGERRFISVCFNGITRLLFGLKAQDINGSPKFFSRKAVKLLDLQSKQNLIDTELMAKAKRLGWKFVELPTASRPRTGGKSHVNPWTILEFFDELLQLRFSKALRDFE